MPSFQSIRPFAVTHRPDTGHVSFATVAPKNIAAVSGYILKLVVPVSYLSYMS